MRVLVACERFGAVRDAFRRRGHDAWSCDTFPGEGDFENFHFQCDVVGLLTVDPDWDLLIGFPPCTYLCSSGLHWNTRDPERAAKTEDALNFVRFLMEQPIRHIAIENPVGCIGTRIRPADQYIQPYQFGHDASKRTGLWLKGLPKLVPTREVPPRMINGKPRWANQTDSGQNRLGPSPDRAALRGKTYAGIADAMADQWGNA